MAVADFKLLLIRRVVAIIMCPDLKVGKQFGRCAPYHETEVR